MFSRSALRGRGSGREAQQRRGHQARVAVHVLWRVARNIFGTFGRRRRFFSHCLRRDGVFRHQTLLERFMTGGGRLRGGTGRKQSKAEQAGGDLDFHSFGLRWCGKASLGDASIITIIELAIARFFFDYSTRRRLAARRATEIALKSV